MELYEVFDLKDVIDQYSGSVTNLNEWSKEASPEALKAIKKAALSVMDGARIVLANENVFYSAFAMSIHLHVSWDLQAPMAVNVTQDGLLTIQNLYVNPFWLIYKLGDKNNGQFVRTDIYEDVVAIYFHELNHLLYEHPSRYRDRMQSGLGQVVNIATDTQINQERRIANNKTLSEYGITLEGVRKGYDLPNLMANKDSEYYYEELYKKLKAGQCRTCGQQKPQNGQNQNGQNQNGQNQNGQNQNGQNQNGQNQNGQNQNGQNQNGQNQNGQNQNGQNQNGQNQNGQNQNGQNQNGQNQNGQSQNGQNQNGQSQNGQSQNGQSQNGQGQNGQGQNGQSQNGQGQNGQGQNGHSGSCCPSCGQPMNGNATGDAMGAQGSHKVWGQIPDNTAEGEIADEMASHESMKNIVKRILDSPDLRKQLSNEKLRGILPGHLYDELIEGKAVKGKLPISAVIRKGTGKLRNGSKRTYTRFNPRQGNRVDILRGKKELHNKNIHCFIDNSGSMGPTEIEYGVTEVAAVASSIRANLSIIPFDTVVYYNNKQEVDKFGKFAFVPTGRGGTSFQPVFDYLKEQNANNDNDVIVIITDGYGESRIDNYGLRNVIWILVEENRNTLSVSPQFLRGHEVAWLEDDAKYKLHKLDKEAGL